ncbi:hypothetical protein PIROE2DRAFT_5994 [Piromyces sp. E2]|nr:hypothetical protein PIROE2DRAFT_5994 [Piromyces sp. E2]|eukprot:OUM66683.1 hypothetical protein PIROE2DRAFT_5994 [Piromyces sp. E2]
MEKKLKHFEKEEEEEDSSDNDIDNNNDTEDENDSSNNEDTNEEENSNEEDTNEDDTNEEDTNEEDSNEEDNEDNSSDESNEEITVEDNEDNSSDESNEEITIEDNEDNSSDENNEEITVDDHNKTDEVIEDSDNDEDKQSDVVFIIDESDYMCDYLEVIKKTIQTFINELKGYNIRVAVIGFGYKPRIYSTFKDISELKTAIDKISCIYSTLHSPGLEAIRMFLNKSGSFDNHYTYTKRYDTSGLEWRENSKKTIIFITIGNSDLPILLENLNVLQKENIDNRIDISEYYKKSKLTEEDVDRIIGFPYVVSKGSAAQKTGDGPNIDYEGYTMFTYYEPSFTPVVIMKSESNFFTYCRTGSPIVLSKPFQMEVDETASLINAKNIQVFMLLDNKHYRGGTCSLFDDNNEYRTTNGIKETDESSTVTVQYGNPLLEKMNDTFDRNAIYSELKKRKEEKSLQGQILSNKGYCRAFHVREILEDESKLKQFYKLVAKEIKNE